MPACERSLISAVRAPQVAKNIEGNQGVLAKVVATLEASLAAARQEKEHVLETARSDRKTWERMLRESERQLREVEKQRDRANAAAVEANNARKVWNNPPAPPLRLPQVWNTAPTPSRLHRRRRRRSRARGVRTPRWCARCSRRRPRC